MPARAVDGQRGTKWVASISPSPEKPQRIDLELFGIQEVIAVAVFGESVDNDGILDAQVQVAGSKAAEFTTVAAVEGAESSRWLATFDPVKTTTVRLLITRSGGPSTHTDVYEIEVFGRPMSGGDLKGYGADRLRGCEARWKEFLAKADELGLTSDLRLAGLTRTIASIDSDQRSLAESFSKWDTLSEPARQSLVAQIERLEVRVERLIPGLGRVASVWPERAEDVSAAREAAEKAVSGEDVVAARVGARLRLTNRRVSVVLDEADGSWEATWLGSVSAAVRRMQFAVEAGDQNLSPASAKAQTANFTDALGSGLEIRRRWGDGIEVERRIRLYHGKPAVVLSAEITNHSDHDITLGPVKMFDLSETDGGWWHLGDLIPSPSAAGYSGASPPCRPSPDEESSAGADTQYGSTAVLALTQKGSPGGMVLGFLSAQEGSPSVGARFRVCEGGTSLGAMLNLGGRILRAGQTVAVDPVWLSVEENPFDALEHYGDAVAALAPKPVRTGANALWCSWYPIRMGIDEEIVLEHAAIAAKHFKPLGLDVIQLDHGWQRGDVCGDWMPNERFPHGLRWLSDQLQSRYGMKLGLWIAPTQVAVNSQLFQDHPEWMAKDAQGQPARTGRWFWVPNPEMTVLDSSQAAAEKWIEETFARLTAEGARYYKIDFIAGSPGLRRAMAAIRRGAGPDAWIRYCQTPPLLSVGLASSAYIGIDTGDAGIGDWLRLERENAPLLAASYWANDRLYHREVCDMSVGMKADVEEARFRLALMTLSGCSISFSDDFRLLEPPRIRMMQQCLPPGNPPARPLDLFQRELPSLWHMHCKNEAGEWDVVGVFNYEDEPQKRCVELAALGLPSKSQAAVFEVWEEKFLGLHPERVAITLAPHTARILLIHRLPDRPRVIATNMHLLGGYHEIKRLNWDEEQLLLSGQYQRAVGLEGKAYLYVPGDFRLRLEAPATQGFVHLTPAGDNLWVQEVAFKEPRLGWSIAFDRTKP
ncbi:MAG: hypothetical protein A2V98_17000 [Planctomycetes bacterium RBG_16_64_12]|nr:MAG: hypothetical protein A2V98_17000 [Planctomycetes bacterium RBG_16_64_12]